LSWRATRKRPGNSRTTTTGTKDAVILSTGMLVALNTTVAVDGQDKTDAKAPHTS